METRIGFATLVGQKVQVWSTGGSQVYSDSGMVVAFDDPWLMLQGDDGHLLCFPVHNIRLVKLPRERWGDSHLAAPGDGG